MRLHGLIFGITVFAAPPALTAPVPWVFNAPVEIVGNLTQSAADLPAALLHLPGGGYRYGSTFDAMLGMETDQFFITPGAGLVEAEAVNHG